MQPYLFSERGFNNITMRELGLPIEAPVSKWGFDYITMRALGSPIEASFCVFARIVILIHEQSVDRDPCLSNVAVLPGCQCADGECQCANGNHRLQIVFSKIEIRPL